MGALAMLPVMANILLINIFILVDDFGPYLIAGLICTSLLILLWHHRLALDTLLWSTQPSEPERSRHLHRWVRSILLLTVASIMISGAILQHRARQSRYGIRPGTPVTSPKP